MKILAVSDFIVQELYDGRVSDFFKGVDLILSCGDLPPEYLTSLTKQFDAPLYYVLGNHDIRFKDARPEGCVDANGAIVRFDDKKILGIQGSHWYNGGPYQYTETQMKKIIRRLWLEIKLKKGVDIVMTHSPPRRIHDREDQCHRGFVSFRRLIEKHSPAYFLHGHIHAHFKTPVDRVTVVGTTQVINVCGYCLLETN